MLFTFVEYCDTVYFLFWKLKHSVEKEGLGEGWRRGKGEGQKQNNDLEDKFS